jgi:hypothetical protein
LTPEGRILDVLEREGPLSGGELHSFLGGDRFLLWKACRPSPSLEIARVGERYLRLDERVEGFARLSPSILREFLTYTVVGTEARSVRERAQAMSLAIREIGAWKTAVAERAMQSAMSRASRAWKDFARPCFILAGDVAYGMAHSEPRPERSLGKMVKGSDLDIVAVLEDDLPDELLALLDGEIYREKYLLLVNPTINQEIDYVAKKLGTFKEQLHFDTFKRMVACKVMREGLFLGGNRGLFDELGRLMRASGVGERIAAMEAGAARDRAAAEERLRLAESMSPEFSALFYSAQESEEFE